jgi:phage-related baseplate assembly protein
MSALPPPNFVNDADGLDPNKILADMIAAFEQASGRTLQPAQVERLLINLYAYRESLVRNAIQYAAEQNLLAFATFPMLDYLGQLLGVARLAAQPALTDIAFTLASALTVPTTIPAGTLIATYDARFRFATLLAAIVPAGATLTTVSAAATVAGADANGYLSGQVNVQVAPNALLASALNVDTTSGGSAPEIDDHLRARIQAAPNEFSVAGPVGAYRFHTLGVDAAIVDVQVISPAPGAVSVYVLTGPIVAQPADAPNNAGVAGTALLAKVATALNSDSIRPLTDTVTVLPVAEVDYQIAGTVTLYSDADVAATMAAANAAAIQFAVNLAAKIQRDIVPSQLVAALSVPGAYEVVLTAPSYTQLAAGNWANCTAISLAAALSTEHS